MFKNLLNFWQGKDFLTQVMADFTLMLDHAENIFTMVSQALVDNKQPENLKTGDNPVSGQLADEG